VKVAAGILTFNQFSTGRHELFERTFESLVADVDGLYVIDNNSDDETSAYVEGMGGTVLRDPLNSCGHGMNRVLSLLGGSGADLCLFSNDDILWRPGAVAALRDFWAAAPDDVLICSGLQQDVFPWSTPREAITCGGQRALVRDSVPGGAWTLRAKDWPKIRPVPEASGWDDVPTCDRLRRKGYRVAALDLAEHLGEDLSTWGNDSARHGTPLDRAAWGLP
jgi:glycosyltransferase involved in cell wall biosynthesis